MLLVSHDLALIRRYADKVVLLDKTVAEQGDAEDVFQTKTFQQTFGYFAGEEKYGIDICNIRETPPLHFCSMIL